MSRPSYLYRIIAERHGEELATSLCYQFGGRTMAIPREARENNPIARALGLPILQTLVDVLGGEKVEIPFGPANTRAAAQKALEQAVAAGLPTREIVSTLKVTRSAVCRARRRKRTRRAVQTNVA